jgi:5-methylcytosine-specific restriction protein A
MRRQDFKKIGNDILEDSKNYFIGSQYIEPMEDEYKVLQLQGNLTLKFREWGNKPFYLILFRGSKYLFELELIKILKKNDRYTWYLSKPKNEKNVEILNRSLAWREEVDQHYRVEIKKVKKSLSAGKVVYKEGYLLSENDTWGALSEKFLTTLHDVIYEHFAERLQTKTVQEFSIDDLEAIEGYRSDKAYLQTKRNQKIVESRKELDGYTCQVCHFKLQVNGKYIIECHHLIAIGGGAIRITNVSDLICLCPTCHRIAHTRIPPYSIKEMKELFKKQE